MKKEISIESWKRKAHFELFNSFDDPFWGLTTQVDCSEAFDHCKKEDISFFLFYLHKSLIAANKVDEFRQRVEHGKVFQYDAVHASPTISREDGTFGFAYFDFDKDFTSFSVKAQKEIEKVKKGSGLKPAISNENVIHYSTVPWVNFTGVEYPRNKPSEDSIPKITFGKICRQDDQLQLPVSMLVNHALIDAFHISMFLEKFQDLMNEI